VDALQAAIPEQVHAQLAALAGPVPGIAAGEHCTQPHRCPFFARCNPPVPEHHVSRLYRVGGRAAELVARGIELIQDVPADEILNPVATRQVRSVREHEVVVAPGLAAALASLRAPVAHLDFETVMPAVPVWNGCHPYQQVAVQMSCHVVDGAGQLEHHEFLAEGPADPRPALAAASVRACGSAKAVVVYHSPMERGQLEQLAVAVPAQAAALRSVIERLVDLLPIVRNHVYHPAFGGSFGLKRVLPALVPELDYSDLAISDGQAAQAALEGLLFDEASLPVAEREALRRDLRAYCGRDTLGLVRIVEVLWGLAA
jgi:hypothetical protein